MENPQLIHTEKALAKWRGADGQFISYEPIRQVVTLALWYDVTPARGYLQLSLGGCTRIELPVRWRGCAMSIVDLEQSKQFKIEDPTLGILIVCSESDATPRKERFWDDLQ